MYPELWLHDLARDRQREMRELAACSARRRIGEENGLRVKVAMFADGSFIEGGRPQDLLLGAVVLHRAGIYLGPLPVWLYRPLIAALAALGRWRGKEQILLARYPDYARLLETSEGISDARL